MAARGRKTANGVSEPPAEFESSQDGSAPGASSISTLLTTPATGVQRDEVKVNNASVSDMKHACDDALKRFLSRPDLFNQIYTHTDVRLGLGWASVLVAGLTGLYGYKIEFEKSKPVVWAGLILYILLTSLQALYAYFVEGDIVFVGKRKTLDKRIVTERITISSTSTPSTPDTPPAYALALNFVRSTSGGKSLLSKGRAAARRGYNTFFDETGVLDQEEFERWVGGAVAAVMEGKQN
ncbi:microsomal signal peptidase 25 kDa subunit-domain-containing protein [Phanerochaete sordida]|uniref:Signal peptidase complex subunit 2 n=1 Tax=Phanerochaete sordida TaxID=48140 RepID=A0A9P3G007_9APHY|nr:microsomal signal peptidase 25 kDa subunit-domain-containing protein [Phanerochaete sordida]